jgi:hypothetical protein
MSQCALTFGLRLAIVGLLFTSGGAQQRSGIGHYMEKKGLFSVLKETFASQAMKEVLASSDDHIRLQDNWLSPNTTKHMQQSLSTLSEELYAYDTQSESSLRGLFPTYKALTRSLNIELVSSTEIELLSDGSKTYLSTRTMKNLVSALIFSLGNASSVDIGKNPKSVSELDMILDDIYQAQRRHDADALLKWYDDLNSAQGQVLQNIFNYDHQLLSLYNLQMMFLLAHEQGHVVLDHKRRLSESKNPKELRKQLELEADSYATRLVFGLYYGFAFEYRQGADLVESNKRGEDKYCLDGMSSLPVPRAEEAFFNDSYSFAGFVDDPTQSPSVAQRLENVAKSERETFTFVSVLMASEPKRDCKGIREDLKSKAHILPDYVWVHGISIYDLKPMFVLTG